MRNANVASALVATAGGISTNIGIGKDPVIGNVALALVAAMSCYFSANIEMGKRHGEHYSNVRYIPNIVIALIWRLSMQENTVREE